MLRRKSKELRMLNLLAKPIQNWTANQGWKKFHTIQVRAVDAILNSNDNVIISANTAVREN